MAAIAVCDTEDDVEDSRVALDMFDSVDTIENDTDEGEDAHEAETLVGG